MLTDEQLKHMVTRFLGWKLPRDFQPDGGVKFEPIANKGTAYENRREPVGTHLLTGSQAEAMIQYLAEGMPVTAPLDLADFGDLALMAVAAVGVHPRVLIDPADALALYNEAKRLAAEVERLTSERDTERAMRIERDGLLAAERERFTAAYDAAQKLAGERDEARVDLEAARRDAAARQIIADDRWAAIERLEAAVEHFKTTNLALVVEVERLRGAVHESLAYDPYGMAGGAQIPLRALNVG